MESKLTTAGINVWIDYSDVRGGDIFPEHVSKAIEWCNTLLLIWSKSATTSNWVKREWTAACNLNKIIIPCRIDKSEIPAILAGAAYIEFHNFEDGIRQLLEALNINQLSKESQRPKPETVKKAATKPRTERKISIKRSANVVIGDDSVVHQKNKGKN